MERPLAAVTSGGLPATTCFVLVSLSYATMIWCSARSCGWLIPFSAPCSSLQHAGPAQTSKAPKHSSRRDYVWRGPHRQELKVTASLPELRCCVTFKFKCMHTQSKGTPTTYLHALGSSR